MNKVKFCVFADYHYWKTHYPNDLEPLKNIMHRAAEEKVDFVIQCGDLCHNAPTAPELSEVFQNNSYGLRTLSCIGNHELEAADSLEEVCKTYGMSSNYEYYDICGFRIIILDTNYYSDGNGGFKHTAPRSWGAPVKECDAIGTEQLNWLERTINQASGKCILFSHATFETDNGGYDAALVRALINKINKNERQKVLMCCNGHYHRNSVTVLDNVIYFNVNAALNVEWRPEVNINLPEDFRNSARMAPNCCFSKDGLSAIVTVEDNGHIAIEGIESEYLYGASPEKMNWDSTDRFGRKAEPRISDADITLT